MLKPTTTLRLLLNRIYCKRLNIRLYCTKNEDNANKPVKYEDIPISNIRNFGIIAHIDHGKSTLADRLLEITGTINLQEGKTQILDSLQVEQERGITVKAVTASLRYKSKITNEEYLLNLVDTPGHVDFCNEVSRALLACQSVILLIDANQGVQAQTVANFYLAFLKELTIIPVLNKIDLKNADPERVEKQLHNLFEIKNKDVLRISAKLGTGIEELLETIITSTPCPDANREGKFKGLLFDNWFDKYRGVIIILYIKDGSVKEGDVIVSNHSGMKYTVKQVGILKPNEVEAQILRAGQIGYISCNMRSVAEAQIGDTFYKKDEPVEPFPAVKTAQPMVYAGVYPMDPSQHLALGSAIEKLILTDSAVSVVIENSPALGQGWRLGFLGLLHMEVFSQRLDQEYDAQAVMTTPSVTYKIKIKGDKHIKRYKSDELFITNPLDLPDERIITEMYEPMVLGTIMMPETYIGTVMNLCMEKRGVQKSTSYIDASRIMIQFILPLNEIIVDFYDTLKSVTSGFASFDYEDYGYQQSDLVKVDILLNGNVVDELCMIVHKSTVLSTARRVCEKLTTIIPRQQFMIAVQAAIGSKILARETIKAYRKDVTAKCYGGDVTRKMKLLRSQAEGKKKMRRIGNIDVPRDTFIQLLKR